MTSQEYSIDSLSDAFCQSLINSSNLVVILGSYISTWSPTNLLSGQQFTQQLFSLIFKNEKGEYYEKTINDSLIQSIFKKLPFEVINSKCPNQQSIYKILKRCFNPRKPNEVHKLFADLIISGKIKAIITTNYDRCLEIAINNRIHSLGLINKKKIDVIVREDDLTKNKRTNNPVVFKIHGSIEQEKTLVFHLDQEGQLEPWKRTFLNQLIHNSQILIIGYSGLDFDICREISVSKPRKVIWNFFDPGDVTVNSKVLEKNIDIVKIYGDMAKLLTKTFSPIKLNSSPDKKDYLSILRSFFSTNEIILWQARLLNALSYSKVSIELSKKWMKKFTSPDLAIELMSELAGGLAPNGKYFDAGKTHLKAAKFAKQHNLDPQDYFRQICCASDAFRGSGNYILSILLHRKMVNFAVGQKNNKNQMEISILRNEILLKQIAFRFLKRLKLLKLFNNIQNSITNQINDILPILLKSGDYYSFQQIQLWASRFDISPSSIDSMVNAQTLQPEDGYEQLYFQLGIIMDFRFRVTRKKDPQIEDYLQIREYIMDAKNLGIKPEIWKLLRLIYDRFPDEFTQDDKNEFWSAFFECQYSLLQRIQKLVFGH